MKENNNNNKKVYVKEDLILAYLEEFGFKYVKKEDKEIYSGNGLEVDCKTREIKSINKSNLYIFILLYNNNLLDIK